MTPRVHSAITELVEALAEAVRAEAATGPAAPDRLYSIAEAAELLAQGRSRIYAEIGAGRLRTVKSGRRRLVSGSAIREYIERAS